jgi:hypothetical protein
MLSGQKEKQDDPWVKSAARNARHVDILCIEDRYIAHMDDQSRCYWRCCTAVCTYMPCVAEKRRSICAWSVGTDGQDELSVVKINILKTRQLSDGS